MLPCVETFHVCVLERVLACARLCVSLRFILNQLVVVLSLCARSSPLVGPPSGCSGAECKPIVISRRMRFLGACFESRRAERTREPGSAVMAQRGSERAEAGKLERVTSATLRRAEAGTRKPRPTAVRASSATRARRPSRASYRQGDSGRPGTARACTLRISHAANGSSSGIPHAKPRGHRKAEPPWGTHGPALLGRPLAPQRKLPRPQDLRGQLDTGPASSAPHQSGHCQSMQKYPATTACRQPSGTSPN